MDATLYSSKDRFRGGFTLPELLITVAVAGVLLVFVYQIFLTQQRSHTVQEQVADAQQSGRVVVDELTRALASLGAGADLERGQVRLLVAQPYQVVFNADLRPEHFAMAPGSPVPGAVASDPYLTVPAGTFATDRGAETYRFTLDHNDDNLVDTADRTLGEHYSFSREINGVALQEVAGLVANPRVGEPLFVYWGDFDGDGIVESADRVDASTSSRIAAGEPLDAVVRKIEVNLITETVDRDPRYSPTGGYRQTRLRTAVSPENLWDCPVVTALPPPSPLRAPGLRGTTTNLQFRVTRGGVPEAGRTVVFFMEDPNGVALSITDASGTVNRAPTDGAGVVTAVVHWPATCADVPIGTYLVRARTAEPPSLATPYGTCSPQEARLALPVIPGLPNRLALGPSPLSASSCGGTAVGSYEFRDACDRPVRQEDVQDDQATLSLTPDPLFGDVSPQVLNHVSGTFTYRSPSANYADTHPTVTRSAVSPFPFAARLVGTDRSGAVLGQADVRVHPRASAMVDLTRTLQATSFNDCPNPALPITDTFGVKDSCGNPLHTLAGSGTYVTGTLVRQPLPPWATPIQGTIASPGNRSTFSTSPITMTQHDGTRGRFAIRYQAPTCTLAGLTYAPQLTLTPSWNPAGVETLPLAVGPCSGCSVQVFNSAGIAVTRLNRECDGRSDLVVTECVPVGTAAEVVIGQVAGSGMLSFGRNGALDRRTHTFNAGARGQTLQVPLYIGTAQTGDQFRIAAFIPSQAAVAAGQGVMCQSELITVDTDCSEILISAVADNPQAVPSNQPADATPLCAAEGVPVYFRVKDCDQNFRDALADDIQNTAGTNRGLVVEVIAPDGTVLDTEGPDLFEVNVHGNRGFDSPYFQGSLPVTQDPADGNFSGRLRAPRNQVARLRAVYTDPDDTADRLCVAEALLVPPLPVCFTMPLVSLGNWNGDLRVHWGDALVAGQLNLPAPPTLVAKDQGAILNTSAYIGSGLDRYVNAYVGGVISIGGLPLTPTAPPPISLDQPFLPNGAGQAFAVDRGNYFQAVADVTSLARRLDYDLLKAIAQARRVYWEPEAGGTLFNPATLQRGTFEQVTALPGAGLSTVTHDGRFLFIDAPPALQSGAALDQAPVALLPTYEVSSAYYTEGLIYVAGSVDFRTSAGQVAADTAVVSPQDSRYDENSGNISRQDLPIDLAQPGTSAIGGIPVNLKGALYCDGRVGLPDGFRVYGAVFAEKGGSAAGDVDVWYDGSWRSDRADLCSQCCTLGITPTGARVALADVLQLTAVNPRGSVVWDSLAPQVATVDQSGTVHPVAVGTVTIRVTDAGGCVAETDVEVF